MKIYVVIPGYNEEKYLAKVLKAAKTVTPHVIYVDDGSRDKSVSIAKKHVKHVLSHEVNLGKGAALKTGSEYAFKTLKADAVVFMDADDQHDTKHLPLFFRALKKYPVVFGVRSMGVNMPLFRFLGNKLASVMLNVLFGAYIEDIPSGFKALTKKAYDKIVWKSVGYEVETEIAMRVAQHSIPFTTVGIVAIYHETDKGMTLLDALHIGRCLIRWRVGL